MKQIFSFLFLMIAVSLCNAQLGKNNVKLNGSGVLNGEGSFGWGIAYERVVEERVSLQLKPAYFFTNPEVINPGYEHTAFGLAFEAKFFFAHAPEAPQGFYMMPFLTNAWLTEDYEDEETTDTDKLHLLQFGLGVGYQEVMSSNMVIDINVGNGKANTMDNELEESDFYDSDFEGYLPRISFGVGYNF